MLDKKKYPLENLRGLAGMSQKELAEKVGLSTWTISMYEKDINKFRAVSHVKLKEIAKALDVSIEDIFIGEE